MYVIKIGGGAAIGEDGYRQFAADLAELKLPAVIVHGGNAEFSQLSRALGMPPRMVTSSSGRVTRYTDRATMDAMLMAYCGKVNKRLVGMLRGGRGECGRAQRHGRRDRHPDGASQCSGATRTASRESCATTMPARWSRST